jgi:hypothetical protein
MSASSTLYPVTAPWRTVCYGESSGFEKADVRNPSPTGKKRPTAAIEGARSTPSMTACIEAATGSAGFQRPES